MNDEDLDKFIENNFSGLKDLGHNNSQSNNIFEESERVNSDDNELNEEIILNNNDIIINENNIGKMKDNNKIIIEDEFSYNDHDLLSFFSDFGLLISREEDFEIENKKDIYNDKAY